MAKRVSKRKRRIVSIFPHNIREWIKAVLIAFIILILSRFFIFDLVSLTDSSMEKTLLSGDVLRVSKYNYGARFPMRIMPHRLYRNFLNTDSIPNVVQLPYWRGPGNRKIQPGDIVLFNSPSQVRIPIDRRTLYAKRIVGMPGDLVEIKNSVAYVNQNVFTNPLLMQRNYVVETRGGIINDELLEGMNIREGGKIRGRNLFIFPMTTEVADSLRRVKGVRAILPYRAERDTSQFPPFGQVARNWTSDNFGPVRVPEKGMSIDLSPENISMYHYYIIYHERRSLTTRNDSVFVNGKYATEYTFRMNYYFVLGDNRHNASDSRIWGLLPENHIKGRVNGIFISIDKKAGLLEKIRWRRIFKNINQNT